ncbi:MAG: hypothetical protein LH617_07940 [Ramlibacter sp.]|nr:hypothetical protein [Ramlibacter sp.]
MKNLIVLLILAIAGYWAYGQYERQQEAKRVAEAAGLVVKKKAPAGPKKAEEPPVAFFSCDGRDSCAQMTSCEEAYFYVKSCPGMSSEGTRGGVSCEKQWCR